MKRILLTLTMLLALAVPTQAHAADTILSNERTFTASAYPVETANVYKLPTGASTKVARLHYFTEDQLPEVYVALRSRMVEDVEWVLIRVPMRPNGVTGWVKREALGEYTVVNTQLVVNRRTMKATFYRKGKAVWSSVVGVGASRTPTPAGHFYIRERLVLGGGGSYGPFAFGTSAYSSLSDWPGGGVVGIHGTNQPSLLPGRVSHGCIRMPNTKILQLKRMMYEGTPLLII